MKIQSTTYLNLIAFSNLSRPHKLSSGIQLTKKKSEDMEEINIPCSMKDVVP
jgi:hypothetical protein